LGIKLALILGFEIGTELAITLAEKSFYLFALHGGREGRGLTFNVKLALI